MKPCEDCEAYRANHLHRVCNPACLACGGRYLWFIQRLQLGQHDKRERLKAALKVWTDIGHDEQAVRDAMKRDWGGRRRD